MRVTVSARDADDNEVEVTATVTPGRPSDLRGHPDRWSAVEGDEIEIETVTLDGAEVCEATLADLDGTYRRLHNAAKAAARDDR